MYVSQCHDAVKSSSHTRLKPNTYKASDSNVKQISSKTCRNLLLQPIRRPILHTQPSMIRRQKTQDTRRRPQENQASGRDGPQSSICTHVSGFDNKNQNWFFRAHRSDKSTKKHVKKKKTDSNKFSFAKYNIFKQGIVSYVQTSSNVQEPNSLVLFQLCPNKGFFVPKKPNKMWMITSSFTKIECIQIWASFNHLRGLFWSSHQSQS